MNRPRTPGRKDLPRWFRARRQGAGGYYISMAVNCMRWIGRRNALAESIKVPA